MITQLIYWYILVYCGLVNFFFTLNFPFILFISASVLRIETFAIELTKINLMKITFVNVIADIEY